MGTVANPAFEGNAKWRITRVPKKCDAHTRRAAKQREQDAFRQGLPHNSGSLGTQRHTQRYLSPPLHAADKHEVGNIGADDQQHKS